MEFFGLNSEEQAEIGTLFHLARCFPPNEPLLTALNQLSKAHRELLVALQDFLEELQSSDEALKELLRVREELESEGKIDKAKSRYAWSCLLEDYGMSRWSKEDLDNFLGKYDKAIFECVEVDKTTIYSHPLIRKRIKFAHSFVKYRGRGEEKKFFGGLSEALAKRLPDDRILKGQRLKGKLEILMAAGFSLERAYNQLILFNSVKDEEVKTPDALRKWVKRWIDEKDIERLKQYLVETPQKRKEDRT
jgi:hypothetical protein